MSTKIQIKRGLHANLSTATLSVGEPAFVTDTGKLYIGDGTNKVLMNPINKPSGIDTTAFYTKVTVNEYGQVTDQGALTATDIPTIPHSNVSGLGTAATKDIGTTVGNIPVLDADGDIPLTMVPNIPTSKVTGLGTAATKDVGTGASEIPVLDASSKLPASVIPNITADFITDLGTVATKDVGTSAGNVPVLDKNGKLAASTIPSIAVTDTFVVATQAEMLALICETGDIAIRTDTKETFILSETPASTLANWVKFATPTDSVTSVNGQSGVVILDSRDILMTEYLKPASYAPITRNDTVSVSIGKLETNFNHYATKNSPAFTGTPTTPTPSTDSNTTHIASTAFVKANLVSYAPIASPTFTGTPAAPTPAPKDNSTQLATTAFVNTALAVIDGGTF